MIILDIKRYRKKPVEIEAVQWDGSPERAEFLVAWAESFAIASTHFPNLRIADPRDGDRSTKNQIAIHTLEGTMFASPGDWIIRGVNNELYPCKPDIFEKTYEELT